MTFLPKNVAQNLQNLQKSVRELIECYKFFNLFFFAKSQPTGERIKMHKKNTFQKSANIPITQRQYFFYYRKKRQKNAQKNVVFIKFLHKFLPNRKQMLGKFLKTCKT